MSDAPEPGSNDLLSRIGDAFDAGKQRVFVAAADAWAPVRDALAPHAHRISAAADRARTRADAAVAKIPGRMAGLGVAVVIVALAVLLSGIPFVFPNWLFVFLNQGLTFMVYAMVLVGLNMQFGDTGVVNFGPVLFLALGAYSMAIVTAVNPIFGTGLGYPWPVGMAAAVVVATAVGGVIGLSTLRLRDDYLAITTLAAAEIFHSVAISYPDIFGGNNGISNLPNPVGALAVTTKVKFITLTLVFLGVLMIGYEAFRRLSDAPYGRVLRAVMADEDATRSVGKNVFRYKLQVFLYGAAIAGLGGALFAVFQGNAAPGAVTIDVTILLWLGMMLGGPGNYRGVVGGLGLLMAFQVLFIQTKTFLPVTAVKFNALQGLLIGLLFMFTIRFRPAGIWGEQERLEVFK